jgi:hypothetical protein
MIDLDKGRRTVLLAGGVFLILMGLGIKFGALLVQEFGLRTVLLTVCSFIAVLVVVVVARRGSASSGYSKPFIPKGVLVFGFFIALGIGISVFILPSVRYKDARVAGMPVTSAVPNVSAPIQSPVSAPDTTATASTPRPLPTPIGTAIAPDRKWTVTNRMEGDHLLVKNADGSNFNSDDKEVSLTIAISGDPRFKWTDRGNDTVTSGEYQAWPPVEDGQGQYAYPCGVQLSHRGRGFTPWAIDNTVAEQKGQAPIFFYDGDGAYMGQLLVIITNRQGGVRSYHPFADCDKNEIKIDHIGGGIQKVELQVNRPRGDQYAPTNGPSHEIFVLLERRIETL